MSLSQLRVSPNAISQKESFYVNTSQIPFNSAGNIVISERVINNITVLDFTPGGRQDYYFPYLHQSASGINIPLTVNEGTIVVTGGMNGCALEVQKKDKYFTFYHDANGKCMGSVKQPGELVCRIDKSEYLSWEGLPEYPENSYPIYQFICVYSNGSWHVLVFGIFVSNINNVYFPIQAFKPPCGNYVGNFNENKKLIKSRK